MSTVQDPQLNSVALNRLEKFLNSVETKMERLEALLPGEPSLCSSSGVVASSHKPRLQKLRNRGKQIFKWSKSQVAGAPGYAMRKMSHAGPVDPHAIDDTGAIMHLYKFLKSTVEEFGSQSSGPVAETRETTPVAQDSDAITMVDTPPPQPPSVKRFKEIYDEHFQNSSSAGTTGFSYNSSAATLVSSSSSDSIPLHKNIVSSTTYTSSACDGPVSQSISSSPSTEQFLQNLELLDQKIEVLIDDPETVAASIKFHNYQTALQHGKERHLHYYELPFPWRENRFIVNGYRFYDSYFKSLLSIINWYGWHNETVNIWTHLCGALYFAYIIFKGFPQTLVYQSDLVPTAAKVMAFVFLFAGVECFIFSVIWHTFNGICHLKSRSNCACVDYTGITILVTASILTTEFVTLSGGSGSPYTWSLLFYTSVTTLLGGVGFFMNWSPKFDRPESRPLRIAFYLLLASLGVLSFVHSSLFHPNINSAQIIKPVLSKSLGWYLIGVVFYGAFIPERWRSDVQVADKIPSEEELSTDLGIITKDRHIHFRVQPADHHRCVSDKHKNSFLSLWWVDYFGCSHTIWHLFVLFGVFGHYSAMLEMYEKRWLIN
ncbi:LANO_0E14400g1_1 [Lachancea nothofagi CBS 11611]|uniref:LANO_0E14400g1_1 n=1 Tax=Lachancea nothofagi CBS 11611 TaxID=1266666 RepID=A0A1G4K004_9SACH|nr:LANO_0E14400g1_1 [Lachancea nothofagi CBS 11611]